LDDRTINRHLGIGAIAVALLLAGYAIPAWVYSPSNVRNIVLSPLFWPYILTGITALVGLALLAASFRTEPAAPENSEMSAVGDRRSALLRIGLLAVVMVGATFAMPWLGMVWTMMLVFAAVALLVRTAHPVTALIAAVVLPLVLYTFFLHVAGVAIPQGEFVRLP